MFLRYLDIYWLAGLNKNSVRRCAETILPEVGRLLVSQRLQNQDFSEFSSASAVCWDASSAVVKVSRNAALTEFRDPKKLSETASGPQLLVVTIYSNWNTVLRSLVLTENRDRVV